nr:hypothetical protein [Solirubrobacterales bacterium]
MLRPVALLAAVTVALAVLACGDKADPTPPEKTAGPWGTSVRRARLMEPMTRSTDIVVSGAREHNLKDISVTIPRDALTVIT